MKVSERIRFAIEEEIRDGRLLPGDAIDEHEIASRFSVSRTPVREALLQLKAQNLLVRRPRAGMVVARMDAQQLVAIWELLVEMEGICVRLACERMTPEERDELLSVHEAARAVVEADDIEGWSAANHAFHDVLYKGSHNPYLRQELLRLRARTGAYLRHSFSALGRLQRSYEQHSEILQAVLARDGVQGHAVMTAHISLDQGDKRLTDFIINLPPAMLGE